MWIILRILLMLAASALLSYFVAWPYVESYAQGKLREDIEKQCAEQVATQPQAFPPERPEIAEGYCACLSDGVRLTRDDAVQLLKRQQPTGLHERLQKQVDHCTNRLHNPHASDAQILHF